MMWTRHKAIITVAAVVILAGLVTGALLAFRGDGPAKQATATPSQQLRSPFTGEPVPSLNRVLAVKIDNIVYARPQTGLTHADIVYVLPVEGGLSRILAVFSSHFPPVIGPVRSARQDDISTCSTAITVMSLIDHERSAEIVGIDLVGAEEVKQLDIARSAPGKHAVDIAPTSSWHEREI